MATDTHTARRPVLAVLPRITGLLNRAVTIALLAVLVFWLVVNFVHGPGQFGSVLLIGITNGAMYALVALGYTLVYGIIELINFAHGDVFMWGTMITVTIAGTSLGLDGSQCGHRHVPRRAGGDGGAMVFCGILNVDHRTRRLPAAAECATAGAADHGDRHLVHPQQRGRSSSTGPTSTGGGRDPARATILFRSGHGYRRSR